MWFQARVQVSYRVGLSLDIISLFALLHDNQPRRGPEGARFTPAFGWPGLYQLRGCAFLTDLFLRIYLPEMLSRRQSGSTISSSGKGSCASFLLNRYSCVDAHVACGDSAFCANILVATSHIVFRANPYVPTSLHRCPKPAMFSLTSFTKFPLPYQNTELQPHYAGNKSKRSYSQYYTIAATSRQREPRIAEHDIRPYTPLPVA